MPPGTHRVSELRDQLGQGTLLGRHYNNHHMWQVKDPSPAGHRLILFCSSVYAAGGLLCVWSQKVGRMRTAAPCLELPTLTRLVKTSHEHPEPEQAPTEKLKAGDQQNPPARAGGGMFWSYPSFSMGDTNGREGEQP